LAANWREKRKRRRNNAWRRSRRKWRSRRQWQSGGISANWQHRRHGEKSKAQWHNGVMAKSGMATAARYQQSLARSAWRALAAWRQQRRWRGGSVMVWRHGNGMAAAA